MDTQCIIQGDSSASQFSHSPHWNYDVFLSFRGEDTRKTFTGHLYSRLCQVGVNTFIDDEELRKGEVISRELEKSIEESRISIVVFSRNYASSSWCLDELVKILECKHKLKEVVFPIFYDIDPSQVRKQTGCFGEALAEHKERFGTERTEKWTAALTEAANLSGWDLQNVANGYEFKFMENIIEQVLQELNQTPLDIAWHPVGLDTRVKEIDLLLQNECEDEVHMVGMYGVGGIGKTTLAKAIYNRIFRHFDGSCFLSNVRSEAEAPSNGLVKLQQKLLCQILKNKDFEINNVAEGIKLIKTRFESKKVLIVLDDLDHMRQLHALARDRSWFGSGSLIIITTRDKHLLCGLRANERYEAKLLNDNEAVQLFSLHAFNHLFPPQDYVELAQDIIKYSSGLPLALATLGSHLQGRCAEEWRFEFEKLKAIPHSDIHEILKISFDGLDDDTQSVFLDIACIFHGFYKDEVTKTLNACGFHSESAISTLVRKCLLQRDMYQLVMHDLVRDMGREIIRMESPRDPGKRSRLFSPQAVHDVLQGNKGSEKVEVLKVEGQALSGVSLSTKAFKKMKNLRVLIIDELHISGDFELLSKELRWFSWLKCPLKCIPSKFPAEKLVVLDMKESNIQEFGLNLKHCKSLKNLDLSYCKHLKRTPNFSGSQSLETLRLRGCSSLKEIHQSIGNLDRLIDLDLNGCKKLTNLPHSICQLKSLENLNIGSCSSIHALPVDLGEMQSLKKLLALYTGIKQLPGSVELLRDLVILEVGGQNEEANRSFSRRRVHHVQSLSTSISQLSITYCRLSEEDIPRDIGSLSSLLSLDLSGNNFQCLPFDFSKLGCLETLKLSDCENLQTLPSVSKLENLKKFELVNCKNLVKITELDNLPVYIEELNMLNCSSLPNPFNEGFFSARALAFPCRKDRNRGLNIYPQCKEVPEWCRNQVTTSSICFTMPPTYNKEHQFLGMIAWCARKFVKTVSPGGFSFAKNESSRSYYWPYDRAIPGGNVELSCLQYISSLQTPFYGQIKAGDKIQISEWGTEITVKKIGVHLLYLDKQGKVTSLLR
ncbi:disease resistance protein Roq1-like isoform X2 [Lycium ferocissimum]|uniref:disease resistance protein Roq1-like isoform X2 n=1 Tax=Lycium ferocissimum TaxID=112874 RepID=UPI002814CC04|nr:disease resistance protein Roq1-like isoform X2 [Lycium ferocissimum]